MKELIKNRVFEARTIQGKKENIYFAAEGVEGVPVEDFIKHIEFFLGAYAFPYGIKVGEYMFLSNDLLKIYNRLKNGN